MKNALIVFKKEFYRVISDRRLLFTTIILPGLIIYLMYSLMGSAISDEVSDVYEHEMIIYVDNLPEDLETMMSEDMLQTDTDLKRTVTFIDDYTESQDEIENKILTGEIDLYLVFPSNFESAIDSYDEILDTNTIPNIDTYHNSTEDYSSTAYNYFVNYISVYKNSVLSGRYDDGITVFTMNVDNENSVIFNEEEAIGKGFASFLPMIIIMFLFSGAMSIGPDSIAGEKERGTIATLLVTPVKRSEIAIGKVLSLSCIALLSALSSFAGIMLSLPKLMQMEDTGANIYGITEYMQILVVLLSTVLVIIGIVSVVSAFAKTIKEASMLILPFYFISIIIGVTSMFNKEAAESVWMYLIPLYSSVNMLIGVLTFSVVPTNFLVMVISNAVYVAVLIYIMNKLFSNEKVMFSK